MYRVKFALPVKKWLHFNETDFIDNLCKFIRFPLSENTIEIALKIQNCTNIRVVLESQSGLVERKFWTRRILKNHLNWAHL